MIGILTFHESGNYGATLQAYALQRLINDYGSQCEIIDYRCKSISIHERITGNTNHNILSMMKKLITNTFYKNKAKAFDKFLLEKCKCSPIPYTQGNIKESNLFYDTYITGSDQVFNLTLTNNDQTYYLGFANLNKRKIAYAASCGKFINQLVSNRALLDQINSFDWISCREAELSKALMSLSKRNIPVVLDPTFLLTKEQWEELVELKSINEDYILVYFVSPKKEYYNFAKKVKKDLNLKVYCIQYSPSVHYEVGFHNLYNVSPTKFLSLIRNARYVVTNSFHGTAFSIIYNRDFWTINDPERSLGNQRITQVLLKVNLIDHFVDYKSIPKRNKICYDNVKQIIYSERDRSIDFLRSSGVIT